MTRARMTRHELKAQDEITNKLQAFTDTAYARKNQILAAAAVVLVLVAGIVGWRWYSARQQTAAQAQLGAVMAAFSDPLATSDKDRYEKAKAEAQKVIDSYGSSDAAVMARYYIGLSQDGLGESAAAIGTLQEVVDQADGEIKPIAQFALAGLYKKQGDHAKAIELLKQIEESGAYSKSAVAYEIAAAFEASGQRDEAQTYYSKVITEFPNSTFRQPSEASLKRMGLPVPVPPPPPSPAPAP